MAYFRECPECGAHLDPDEKCDCQQSQNNIKTKEDVNNVGSESYSRSTGACKGDK